MISAASSRGSPSFERLAQPADLLPVAIAHLRMQRARRRLGASASSASSSSLRASSSAHAVLDRRRRHAADDRVDEPLRLALDLRKLGLGGRRCARCVSMRSRLRCVVYSAQKMSNSAGSIRCACSPPRTRLFEHVALDRQAVVAGALVARGRAAEVVSLNLDEAAAAARRTSSGPRTGSAAGGAPRSRAAASLRPLCCDRALPRLDLSHSSWSMMRSSGTSLSIHSESGLSRETRLPVSGSLM